MSESVASRLKHAWNVFLNRDPTSNYRQYGASSYIRPDRIAYSRGTDKTILNSLLNRIALDAAAIELKHVKLDSEGRYMQDMKSGLNDCLNVRANVDQTGRAFKHDLFYSMLSEGVIAIVPVYADMDPTKTGSYDIETIRVGKVKDWYPQHVKVELYNDLTGLKEEVTVPKRITCLVENPLWAVINEPNSIMQRLVRKLNLLDAIDEQSGSGKLDLIIQLPYLVKTEARKKQAEDRRKEIETQLVGSKYGIAYTDGTEHITQLNRPVENNLMSQIEYLTSMLYSQLGITQSVMDGTADEKTMLNYMNRTIEPLVAAVVDEIISKFITQTGRTQGQSILYFRDPFKLVPVSDLAEIADKLTRNEIVSTNEFRQVIGRKPSTDPRADELINKNLPQADIGLTSEGQSEPEVSPEDLAESMNSLDELDAQLAELEAELGSRNPDDEAIAHYASPYYDPVKAHEYYMKNRELKGSKSTSALNDEGREVAEYAKRELDREKRGKLEDLKNESSDKIADLQESTQETVNKYAEETQTKIDELRAQLEDMSDSEKLRMKSIIYSQIDTLRKGNADKRKELQKSLTKSIRSLTNQRTKDADKLSDEYEDRYLTELTKLRSESKYKKVSSTSKSGSSGSKPLSYYMRGAPIAPPKT